MVVAQILRGDGKTFPWKGEGREIFVATFLRDRKGHIEIRQEAHEHTYALVTKGDVGKHVDVQQLSGIKFSFMLPAVEL